MKKIIITLAAMISIMACTKGWQEVEAPLEGGPTVTLYASFDSEKETKVTTEDGLSFNIDANESIGVYVEHSVAGAASNVKFNAGTAGEDGWVPFNMDSESPYIKLPELLGDVTTNIYAYGPYNVINGDVSAEGGVSGEGTSNPKSSSGWDGTHYVTLTSSQEQASAEDVTSVANYYAYAAVPTKPVNTNGTVTTRLSFSGIYALVKFEVTNSLSEAVTVNKVKLTTDGALTGDFSVNLKENPRFSNTSFALTGVAEKTKDYVEVALSTPAVVEAGSSVCLYAVVNSGAFSNAVIDVYAENTEGKCFFTRTIEGVDGKLPRNSRTTFKISLTEDNIYPLTIEGQIARGGEVEVNEAVDMINLNGLNIAKNVVVKINAPVGKMILYGNNPTSEEAVPNIRIEVAKDVAYPSFDFGYSAQSTVRNLTLAGDPESTALYAGSMQMWDGENITIDGINFAEGGFINSCGKTATGVKNLVIQNCKAIDGKRNGAFLTLWHTDGLTIKNNHIISTNKDDGNGCSYASNQDVFVLDSGIKGKVLIENNVIDGSLNHHAIWIAGSPEAEINITGNRITKAYEDAVKIDQAVNVSVTKNTLDAGINGVSFDNFNGTAATLTVTENTISTKGEVLVDGKKETGYGIYLKNKSNTATNVTLTAKDNLVGADGIKDDKLFAKAETLTIKGDYATPFVFNASSVSLYLEQGGDVVIDFPVETIDFKALNIRDHLTLILKNKVNEIKLGGNVDSNNIIIKIEKGVAYPKFTFNENAKNITIQGDKTSSELYSNRILLAAGAKNITVDGIRFNYAATGDNSYTIDVNTDVDGLTISNCVQENLGQRFVHVLNSSAQNINIVNNSITCLDGSRNSGADREMDVLYINGASNVNIQGNTITNSMNHHAIYVDGGSDITITGNTVTNAFEDAIKVDRATSNVKILDNILSAKRNGIRFDNFSQSASGIVITGNTVSTDAETADSYAIHFKNASSAVTVNATVNGNKIGTIAKEQYCRVNTEKIALNGEADKAFTVVEGERYITIENAYALNNAAALKWFADEVNTNGKTFSGRTVKLLDNITLTGNWTPIGTSADNANKFQGTFDGNGKTISGLIVNQSAGYHAAGFFGALNGTAKNFTIVGAQITNISQEGANNSTNNGTAVVAGSIYTSGSISGVTVNGSAVSGNRYVGGIAGYVYGNIDGCTVSNTSVTSTPDNLKGSYDNGDKAGAIVGFLGEGSFSVTDNKVSDVTIHAYRDMGGVVGIVNTGNIITGNNVNTLTLVQDYTLISETQTTVAPIIGRYNGTTVTESGNTSTGVTIKTIADGITVNNTAKTAEISKANGMVWANNNLFTTSGYSYKLTENIDMDGISWATKITGEDSNGQVSLTFDGNNKTISNWSTTSQALLVDKSNNNDITIKNLNLSNCSVNSSTNYAALLYGNHEVHTDAELVIENVNVTNSSIESTKYAGALIGYTSSTGKVAIKDCSVTNTSLTGGGSTAAFIGHDAGSVTTIENATVTGCTIEGEDLAHSGVVIGTIQRETSITVSDVSGNTVQGENSTAIYGRIVGGCLMTVDGVTVHSNGNYDGLKTALSKAYTTVRLIEGTYIVPEAKNKTLKFIGIGNAENTILKVQENDTDKGSLSLDGSTVTFENIKIKASDVRDKYVRYVRCAGTYKNCIIDGEYFLGANSSFEKCTFTAKEGVEIYNVWTYGTNSTFTDCTFNGNGKAVLVYNESSSTDDTVTFNNCTFNDNNSLTLTKAAIEAAANDGNVKHKLIINSCKTNEGGFSVTKQSSDLGGDNLGTVLWGNKNKMTKENLAVIIDGEEVY